MNFLASFCPNPPPEGPVGYLFSEEIIMNVKSILAIAGLFASVALPAMADDNVVTIYSADGLHDGTPSWFGNQFDAFTKATGIKVQYVEAGSERRRRPDRQGKVEHRRPTCWSRCRPSCRRRRPTACCSPTRRPAPTRSPRATRTRRAATSRWSTTTRTSSTTPPC